MSEGDRPVDVCPPAGSYHLCDLARASQEFALADRGTGEVLEFSTDREAREAALARYPGARFLLTTSRSVVEGEDLGVLVVMAVYRREAPDQPWRAVACVTGAVHGPYCVPFAMQEVWPDASDGLVAA